MMMYRLITVPASGSPFITSVSKHLFFGLSASVVKQLSMALTPSMGSVDSEYDMGSTQSDLGLPEDATPHGCTPLATTINPTGPAFLYTRPTNLTSQTLIPEGRKVHNHSSVSFREGRRASDTSLTQGSTHDHSVT